MRRALVALLVVAQLAAATASRGRLEKTEAAAVTAGLLYLPEGPFLRAMALGHEETLADLLYIWAIQYYSNYEDESRYEYLNKVFHGAITELDPLFIEPYLVGGLIMSLEARSTEDAIALYEKGLRNRPDAWEIAYWAGWESYLVRDYLGARRFWLAAQEVPGAPRWIRRMAARMLEKAGDLDAALAEYRDLYANADDEATRSIAATWLDQALKSVAMETVEKALAAWRAEQGSCPPTLRHLAGRPEMSGMPPEIGPEALRYDSETCTVLPAPGVSIGRPQ